MLTSCSEHVYLHGAALQADRPRMLEGTWYRLETGLLTWVGDAVLGEKFGALLKILYVIKFFRAFSASFVRY